MTFCGVGAAEIDLISAQAAADKGTHMSSLTTCAGAAKAKDSSGSIVPRSTLLR
jgi:hypothetical protein